MFEILGYIFAVIIIGKILSLIICYIINIFIDDDGKKYYNLNIQHSMAPTEYGWYIIPTIHISITNWFNLSFYWLCFGYYISFYLTTEDEENRMMNAYYNKNDVKS